MIKLPVKNDIVYFFLSSSEGNETFSGFPIFFFYFKIVNLISGIIKKIHMTMIFCLKDYFNSSSMSEEMFLL